MFKKKIAFKLTAGFVIIVLIAMLVIGLIFIQMFRQYTFKSKKDDMLKRARDISVTVGENTISGGVMRGFGGFMRFLDVLSDSKIWITDEIGSPAAMSGMGGHVFTTDSIPDNTKKIISKVLKGQEIINQEYNSLYNEETLIVGVPIYSSDKTILGTVLLIAPVKGVTKTFNKAIYILIIGLIIGLIIAISLGLFYSLIFTKPLKRMNQIAVAMTNGNYLVKTGINRKDELGQLGNSLDTLASKLNITISQLYQEKNKNEDIISSISEGIVAFDLDLNIINSNKSLAIVMNRQMPYLEAEIKKDFTDLGIIEEIKKVSAQKNEVQILKNWSEKKLKFIITHIDDNQANVQGSVALIQDISESERLEQMRKDFVANVSHEFRTPLTVIRGSLEALVDETIFKKADIKRYYERMISETKSLERLVGDLLELSRLQSGKISIYKEKINIANLITDTVKSMQTIANKKEIKIKYKIQEDLLAINADYDRFRQMIIIFVDNAIKYSSEKNIINLEVFFDGNIKIIIKDQGYGISEEELPYIWDRFYKSDKSRNKQGTGLGLAIASHLVKLHDGEVTIKSKLGIGTTITIKLPKS